MFLLLYLSRNIQLILLLVTLYTQSCLSMRRGAQHEAISFVNDLFQTALIGKLSETEQDNDVYVQQFNEFFSSESRLLMDILRERIKQNSHEKKVILSVVVDVPKLTQTFAKQHVELKYSGGISDDRWSSKLGPLLSQTVS